MKTEWWTNKARVASMAAALTIVLSASADASPRVGDHVPRSEAAALDGRTFDTRATHGNLTLIFYEDKDSAKQNQALKNELHAVKRSPGFKPNVRIIAVVDVSGYDWWPARGFVEDAIRTEERKAGAPIYLDWSGDFGKAFQVTRGVSNIVLVGEDGKVRLTHVGVAGQDVREKIEGALRRR